MIGFEGQAAKYYFQAYPNVLIKSFVFREEAADRPKMNLIP